MTSILVVEDESIVARQLSRTLRTLGYTVPATAANADDALLFARLQGSARLFNAARHLGHQVAHFKGNS